MSSESTPKPVRRPRRFLSAVVLCCLPLVMAAIAISIKPGWGVLMSSAAESPRIVALVGEIAPSIDMAAALPVVYFSLDNSMTYANGVVADNEDIVVLEGDHVRQVFDGSDVGLAKMKLNSFSVVSEHEILLTLSANCEIAGIDRVVRPTDVIRFNAEQLGEETSGSFELYFAGANVGLDDQAEHIDALDRLSDGRLVMSTTSSFSVPGVEGHDEDLLVFTAASFGDETSGTWELFLDGSDVEWSGQDVDAVAVDSMGRIHFSALEDFTPAIGSVSKVDVIRFTPTALGTDSTGTYSPEFIFHGSKLSLDVHNVKGIDVGPRVLPRLPAND